MNKAIESILLDKGARNPEAAKRTAIEMAGGAGPWIDKSS